MKNKIFKLLSVVMALAMVFTMFTCVVSAEETYQDVVENGVLRPALASGTVNGTAFDSCVASHATRLYTYNTYLRAEVISITVAADCRIYVQFFNENGSYAGGAGWKNPGTYDMASLGYEGAKYFKVTYSSTKGGNDAQTPPVDGLTFAVGPNYVLTGPDIAPVEPEEPEAPVVPEGAIIPELVQGTIDKGTEIPSSANRLFTSEYFAIADYEQAVVSSGFKMYFQFYNADKTWISGNGWKEGAVALSESGASAEAVYFKFSFGRVDNANITPADAPNGALYLIKKAVTEEPEVPVEPEEPGQIADIIEGSLLKPLMASGTVNGAPYTVDTCVGPHSVRLYTVTTFKAADIYSITVAEGCRAFVQFFKADGSYNAGSGWITGAKTEKISKLSGYAKDGFFKVTFDSADGKTTPPADGLSFIINDVVDKCTAKPLMAPGTVNGAPKTLETCVGEHATRLYTVNDYEVKAIETITVAEGCRAFVQFWKEDGTYNGGGSGWLYAGTYQVASMAYVGGAKYLKITFGTADDKTVPSADALTFGLAHAYDDSCDTNCNVCDAVREITHTYDNDCDVDCNVCGATREVAGHAYDDEFDAFCNNCNEMRENVLPADKVELKEIDGVKYIYVNGITSVEGLFKVGDDYYYATWGGVVLTGDQYVARSYCDMAAGRHFFFAEDGKMVNGFVTVDGVKKLYIDGQTSVEGLFEVDGKYYLATWGGVVLTDGRYYVTESFVEGLEAGKNFTVNAEGEILDGIVEIDGQKYLYDFGTTVVPGDYTIGETIYTATWGGLIVE